MSVPVSPPTLKKKSLHRVHVDIKNEETSVFYQHLYDNFCAGCCRCLRKEYQQPTLTWSRKDCFGLFCTTQRRPDKTPGEDCSCWVFRPDLIFESLVSLEVSLHRTSRTLDVIQAHVNFFLGSSKTSFEENEHPQTDTNLKRADTQSYSARQRQAPTVRRR